MKEEEGIEPLVTTFHPTTHWAFYYKDPDENVVELLADGWGDREKSLAAVKQYEKEDPMGPRVDPALMIEARKQGASLDELRERTMRRDFQPASFNGPEVLM